MTKFSIEVNKQGNYECELNGSLEDLAIAVASVMQENEVVKQLITGSIQVYEAMELDEIKLTSTHVCCNCEKQSSNYDDFETDLDADVDKDELTCESCYDEANN